MTTLGILQARMSSTRLPGKVLAPILGEPMILRQLERLKRAKLLDGIVVATSTDTSDDPLVDVVEGAGFAVFRGSLDDVLDRFVQVIVERNPDVVVRLTADCPLASPILIDHVVRHFLEGNFDYASNTLTPTYPDGLDVEVVVPAALKWVSEHSADPHEREHVTLGVYRRPGRFRLSNFEGTPDLSDLRWTVDTVEDLEFVRAIYEHLFASNGHFDSEEILEFLSSHPELIRADSPQRNAALNGIRTGAMQHRSGRPHGRDFPGL